jgi:hypothetical protein
MILSRPALTGGAFSCQRRITMLKELIEKARLFVVEQVLLIERTYVGEPGSVKRQAVIDSLVKLIDIPMIPNFIEAPIIALMIGYLIDLAVEKLNWLTGYSFKDVELSDGAVSALASSLEAPIPILTRAASGGDSLEERIAALLKLYGIEPEVKEIPQQETIQAETPVAAVAPKSDAWPKILDFILLYEGGYSNHPDDPGGETNRGITKETLASAYAAGIVKHNDVKAITKEDASAIYKARYYLNYGYDKFPFQIAIILTDTTVNLGRGGAAKVAQRACVALGSDITVDGKWGPKTQAAVEKQSAERLGQFARLLLVERKAYYDGLSTINTFRNGWYNRLNALASAAGVKSPV